MARKSKKQLHLESLESEIKKRGVKLGYERLKFAGLVLKSGLCWFRGKYYLFVDRLLPVSARIELLEGALEELDQLAAAGRLENPAGALAGVEGEPASEPQAEARSEESAGEAEAKEAG